MCHSLVEPFQIINWYKQQELLFIDCLQTGLHCFSSWRHGVTTLGLLQKACLFYILFAFVAYITLLNKTISVKFYTNFTKFRTIIKIIGVNRTPRPGWFGIRGGCTRDDRGDGSRRVQLRAWLQFQTRGQLQVLRPSETCSILAGAPARGAWQQRSGAAEQRTPVTRMAHCWGGRPSRSKQRPPEHYRATESRAWTHPRQADLNQLSRDTHYFAIY